LILRSTEYWLQTGGENLQDKPHHPWIVCQPGALLPRPEWLAAFLDGVGKRSSSGRATGELLPAFSGTSVSADLSPKTIQKHVDNIWALGGEIIRDLNENPSLRRKNIERILVDALDGEGGPLLYGVASEEQ